MPDASLQAVTARAEKNNALVPALRRESFCPCEEVQCRHSMHDGCFGASATKRQQRGHVGKNLMLNALFCYQKTGTGASGNSCHIPGCCIYSRRSQQDALQHAHLLHTCWLGLRRTRTHRLDLALHGLLCTWLRQCWTQRRSSSLRSQHESTAQLAAHPLGHITRTLLVIT